MENFASILAIIARCVVALRIFYRKNHLLCFRDGRGIFVFLIVAMLLVSACGGTASGGNATSGAPTPPAKTPTVSGTSSSVPTSTPPPPTPKSIPTPKSAKTPVQPTQTPVVAPGNPTPVLIVNLPPSALEVVADAPRSMQVGQSYVVKVSLIPKDQKLLSKLVIEKATPTASSVVEEGTPGVSLSNAFGAGYTPRAFATLSPDAGPFKIVPISPREQALDQHEVVWTWSVVPQTAGTSYLSAEIQVIWLNGKEQVRGPYRIGDTQLSIDIQEPSVTMAPVKIDIGAILSNMLPYLLGTGGVGLVALVLPRIKKQRDGGKKSKESQVAKREEKSEGAQEMRDYGRRQRMRRKEAQNRGKRGNNLKKDD